MSDNKELAPFEKQDKYQMHLRDVTALPHVLEAIAAIHKIKRYPSESSRNKRGALKNHLTWLREDIESCILNDEEAKSLKNELAEIYG